MKFIQTKYYLGSYKTNYEKVGDFLMLIFISPYNTSVLDKLNKIRKKENNRLTGFNTNF